MCRLTAYLGKPLAASTLVFGGRHPLFRQSWAPRELLSGSVNADGYGVAWYAEGSPGAAERRGVPGSAAAGPGAPDSQRANPSASEVARADGPDTGRWPGRVAEARPIWQDEEELRTTLGLIKSSCVVAALRNGTPGIPMDRSGLLPLTYGRWTFVLNGFVPDFRDRHMRELRAALPDRFYAALRGSSDSETLFLLVLAALEQGAAPLDALRACVRAVAGRTGSAEAQLNMLLTDGRELVAVRTGTVGRTNSMYMAEGHPMAPAGVLLASEALDGDPSWRPVEEHGAIIVEGAQGVTTEPFGL